MAVIHVGLTYGGKQYKTLPAGTVSEDRGGVKPIEVPLLDTGYSDVLFVGFCHHGWFQVDTTNLIAGDSVSITIEGSLDNVGWDTLTMITSAGAAPSATITTNRTTLLYFRDALPGYVRIKVEATLVSGSITSAVALQAYFAIAS